MQNSSAMAAEQATSDFLGAVEFEAFADREEDDASSTFLTFDLEGQTFAVSVEHVREILDEQPITRLPNAPHDVHGVIDVRGTSVPIVDLSGTLGASAERGGEDTRIVVFEIAGHSGEPKPVGIRSDRVRDVCRIEPADIESPPEVGNDGIDPELIIGLSRRAENIVVVIHLSRVFEGWQGVS